MTGSRPRHCVELADGTRSNGIAERRGDAEVCLIDSRGRRHNATLRQALYIPSYPQDTFCVKAATASRVTVIFKEGKDVLQDRDGTEFHIHEHNRLYYLHTGLNPGLRLCADLMSTIAGQLRLHQSLRARPSMEINMSLWS
ncbi:hypothetical protein AAFF_G00241030 [Aldrovandia affinis]|uniref:Uncharacterized protein n=1 Tax=Aldrovandia affinis TaxID=143900 RepID=A0AAD7SUL5_9TELE|nr:hypothetical protein AAFF_G00241030 [Aldrovandia affinis]